MMFLIQFLFLLGILMVPIALFIALPLIVMPGDSHLLTWIRGWATVLGIWAGPALLCLCTMNYKFTVLRIDVSKFLPEKKELATRLAAIFEKTMDTLNVAYIAYWTRDNRIAFACLACIVTAFALSQASVSLKPFEVAGVKLGGIIILTFMVLISVIHNFRLKKANV